MLLPIATVPRGFLPRLGCILWIFAMLQASAQGPVFPPTFANLKSLSLEQLGNIEVTTESKEPTEVWNTPSAIYVLTQEDIRRSGVSNVADALRLVPGVNVARVNGSRNWAVAIRVLGDQFSRYVLVLIDGRSVYTPLFGGVFWTIHNVMIKDVDRIEVIRGSGGTIWGTDAVNGIINIITKPSSDTQGVIVSLARTARLVSRYRDYSLRFEPTQSYNELALLTEAFNEMLAEIQRRDAALEQARNDLELRVEERTAQLRAANRELESFSYTVAHDLRGPLEIISNICYLIQNQDQQPPQDTHDPMIDRLRASVAEMSNVIDDLLNLSRATSAGLHIKQMDLSALACSILKDLDTAHPDRHVERIVQPGCHTNADKGLMQIVLQNLLRNAWKFTGRTQAARIEFGCTQDGPESVYFVRDNGAGFDQRMSDRLFKPFHRLHTESEFAGSGIGLAAVHRIIARHDGKIWAEGEVGKGATFYFKLGSPKL